MLSERQFNEKMANRHRITLSIGMVLIMLFSTMLIYATAELGETTPATRLIDEEVIARGDSQSTAQNQGQGGWGSAETIPFIENQHPALWDMMWTDSGISIGKIIDLEALAHQTPSIYGLLEENQAGDHDNDGIDDLNDLDDDNDGIYDLLERFDGCYGTDPYDHDNDGILDHLDWDDDNDGILEGPIDYEALEALGLDPMNVTMHRSVASDTIHPLTGLAVGDYYLADQQPFDHDNDGVPDEDIDGSGPGRYDEDDDNDGRIDQFKWPCDFDSDGFQDYFDDDDDGDGINDLIDLNPYDKSVTGTMSGSTNSFDAARLWTHGGASGYRDFSAGINFETTEQNRVDANDDFDWEGGTDGDGAAGVPSFTDIHDGDLDGDGNPNFLDPDNDNDGTPDSADNDDDNDLLLDMWDPDDDNDGIADTCWNIDVNGDGLNDYTQLNSAPYQTPGADGDGDGIIDCEIDYDGDLDDDRWRAFDQNYNGIWDWLDADMGGTQTPDDEENTNNDAFNFAYDMDDDQIQNENDSFPLNSTVETNGWNCPTLNTPVPLNPDPKCDTMRASFAAFNDWDGDGISNWDDVDDDGDGIIDILDIDWDCDLDNDADLHDIDGSKYRDDGPNSLDSDIDGDGLTNSIDWDDDNDGLTDLYDPDDGNCGIVDYDLSDGFVRPYYPQEDGDALDGSADGQTYSDGMEAHWNMVFMTNPFLNVGLNYNGFDATTNPVTNGNVPEFYWFIFARWSSYNGGNEWDVDSDGDSLLNGLDIDQDADGMPDWWDQDESNDGIMDVDDIKMGGSFNMTVCGWVAGNLVANGGGYTCGYDYAAAYHMPLTGTNAQFGSPYSTRPDAIIDQGALVSANVDYSCTPGAQGGCWHYEFDQQTADSALTFQEIENNRDGFLPWIGLRYGIWQWTNDAPNGVSNFPDELGADKLDNHIDGDIDGDFTNNSLDLDDDYDSVYDWYDVDDDNNGLWDYFEVDTDDDLDTDEGQLNSNFFSGLNCIDNDDDGNDADVDDDGWFQPVWDRGNLSQGLRQPKFYDVDNDNDGVPDPEDLDDDNNGNNDVDQELDPGCFWGEEQSPFDHDNDGIVDWSDDDFDGDGISNTAELAASGLTAVFDHDNDGARDDLDDDDDEDGMEDEDEVLLWPSRFDRNSTNPWDHDDFGNGEALANPSDLSTGPDGIDQDDDWDSWNDLDFDHMEEGQQCTQGANTFPASDWDHDNDCKLDADDKASTFINLAIPDTLWLDAQTPAIFRGSVEWINPTTLSLEPAPGLPVQVHIEWNGNNTTAIETIDVLTDAGGNFSVGQFLFPEDLHVGDATTYRIYAEVTEMFAFNGNRSIEYDVGCKANLTVRIDDVWEYFRSDEQPFWLDFYSLYEADYNRAIYDNRIRHAPITFEITGGDFGNTANPTNFTGPWGSGYMTDSVGLATLTFVQDVGSVGSWKQIKWNSTADNGLLQPTGGYEEIIWNNLTKKHDIVDDGSGNPTRYYWTNTSLPAGEIQVIGHVIPELAGEWPGHSGLEWPFPYLNGDKTEPQNIRVMHRMNIEGQMTFSGISPVYYWKGNINNFDGTFGNWASLFHQQALNAAGITFEEANLYKPYPLLWDGNPASLAGEEAKLRGFLSIANSTHWRINLVNGGDSDLPPCGPVTPSDPASPIRCEIVPEMKTLSSLDIEGKITNRTNEPWDKDPISLQVDIDGNGQFSGISENAGTINESKFGADASYAFNWNWKKTYAAGNYGMRVDFTNGKNYFTGNSTELSPTGAYINVTVVGTTQFLMQSVPRLYRNTTTTIDARLLDQSGNNPIRDVQVNWTWSYDGRQGVNYTDGNGVFQIPFEVNTTDDLGNYTLTFQYAGNQLFEGNIATQSIWVVSRTYLNVVQTDPNFRQSGDRWDFTAQVADDNMTYIRDSGGLALDGENSPGGGLVDVIYEGTDFNGVTHRQVVATLAPNAGLISLPEPQPDGSHLCFYDGNGDMVPDRDINNDGVLSREETIGCLKANITPLLPQLLSEDPDGFLPNGFGPVSVILRFEETLPNEGCLPLNVNTLGQQGKWDPCVDEIGNDHFRVLMSYNTNGFSLIGRTNLVVDDQIVYTSEINPLTGLVVPKPMVVTGQISDELGTNLSFRKIRVNYEMVNSAEGPIACLNGVTDIDGKFAITCPLDDITAGNARVSVIYSAWDNNDAYRYQNKTLQTEFDVFSNSSLVLTEVGPFRSSIEQYIAPNGTIYDVLYLKESFHIDAILSQSNGLPVGGKCLNIYLDPEQNVRPIATIHTRESDGTIEWYSSDPTQNPTLRGVETTGGKLEGFRTLKIAFEPDRNVPGGCDKETSTVLNGSFIEKTILVRSQIDLTMKTSWANAGSNGLLEGDQVLGEVALLRKRLDLAVESEEIWFVRQYWDASNGEWVTEGRNESITNEQGMANFEWAFSGRSCEGEPCSGRWRIVAYYPGSTFFAESSDNITLELSWQERTITDSAGGFFTPSTIMGTVIMLMSALIAGILYYRRSAARRQIEALRGILTDTMLQLQAANEYIAIIFDCYKQLVKHFRRHGFMKKVYETTREFEAAVRNAFYMVPADQLGEFLSIFEEARYSDHDIGPSHRDRAMQTLGAISQSLDMALGDAGMIARSEEDTGKLYDQLTKAGEFKTADGTVIQAGLDSEAEQSNFKI